MNIKKINRKKKSILIGCTAGALILAVAGWNVLAGGKKAEAVSEILSENVQKMDLSKSIQGTGVLEPENSTDIKVPTGIRITEIKVKAGDDVKAGDVLALTDSGTVTAELLEAKEKLAEVEKKRRQTNQKKAAYFNLENEKKNLEEKINILQKIAETNSIIAPANGTVTNVTGAAGEVNKSSGSKNDSQNKTQGGSTEATQKQNMSMKLSQVPKVSWLLLNDVESAPQDALEKPEENQEAGGNQESGGNREPGGNQGQGGNQGSPEVLIPFPELKLAVPVTGEPQTKTIEETEQYRGTIEWNHVSERFEEKTVYAARIVLTAKDGFAFEKEVKPEVLGAVVSDVEYAGRETVKAVAFTALYPETEESKEKETEKAKEEEQKNPPQEENKQEQPEAEDNSAGSGSIDGSWSGGDAAVSGGFSSGGTGSADTGDGKSVNTELVSVFSISSGDKMKLNIQIDEMDILSVSEGQKSVIMLSALPGKEFEGKITHINKVGTANGGVTKYTVQITAAKNEKMLSGMNASASVLVEEKKGVLSVPAAAVFEEGGKSYVFTSYDKKSSELSGKKEVDTGMTDGMNIEIVKGIDDGTTVYYQASSGSGPVESTVQPEMPMDM